MTYRSFPRDDYTPYGYLDNPYDAGPWEGLEAGGVLRSLEACGFGWCRPSAGLPMQAGLRVGVQRDGMRLLSKKSFRDAGVRLVSRYHTSRIQSFDFISSGVTVSLSFLLAGPHSLLCRASLRPPDVPLALIGQVVLQRPSRRNARTLYHPDSDTLALLVEPGPWYVLLASQPSASQRILDDERIAGDLEYAIGEAYSHREGILSGELEIGLSAGAGTEFEVWIVLARGPTPEAAFAHADAALASRGEQLALLQAEDERFWARAPRPEGDWPDSWRRGWVYDLETTRLMVRPPAGVFHQAWPTWQLLRPRVVLAENTLDMGRLAYADPETAQAAVLSLFRHAPQPNVPCLFANGSLNMIAEGGDACGTSPAWCLPFHNIYLLYLWHPDKAWLRALYPYLENYLQWWLQNRRDADGWFVYRCTWEAGEDNSLRLDPAGTGHNDISHLVRPVELQAAMAQSAQIMLWLAHELGLEEGPWRRLFDTYAARTRSLWDAASRRFRDQYPTGVPRETERGMYWDMPADISPLQLTPLLYGTATPEHAAAARPQLTNFNRPPWTSWPSWAYTLVEAARAIGAYREAGRIAHDVLSLVYPRLDRRTKADNGARPGTSHEWWPDNLARTTALNETYGWGATTATLLLRHLFGFGPGEATDRIAFELAPALQGDFVAAGRRLGFANLHFRGATFDLSFEMGSDAEMTAQLVADSPLELTVDSAAGMVPVKTARGSCTFKVSNFQRYLITMG